MSLPAPRGWILATAPPAAARRPTRANDAFLLLDGGEHNQASWKRMLPAFLQWAYGRQGPATTR